MPRDGGGAERAAGILEITLTSRNKNVDTPIPMCGVPHKAAHGYIARLLDAGLNNTEAFAANAFFSVGMVIFEVPTGVVADTRGRRFSFMLGAATLLVSTLAYLLMWQIEAPFVGWALASILLAFVVMKIQGLGANIMSLGGIAISIGVLVDAAVVMVENAHKHYEEWWGDRSHFEIILKSAQEVGPTLFLSLLVITVSFMPVFTLEAQEGRMFRPLPAPRETVDLRE